MPVDRLLELASRHADAAEVFFEETESRPVQFENNRLKYIHTKNRRAASVRVIANGRIGFASTTDLSDPARLVAQAMESAQFGQEAKLAFPGPAPMPSVAVHDPAVVSFAIERGVELGRDAIATVLVAYPDVLCSVEISKWLGHSRLANTQGLDVASDATAFECYISALRIHDGGLLWVGEGESSRALVHDIERYTAKIVSDIRQAETESAPPAGAFPVLFTAKAMGLLLEIIQTAVNGKLVQKGASPLVGRLGEQVADARITLADDATRDYGDGSEPHDGEGTPSRPTPLLEQGVLRHYLYDLQTAGVMGTETTGNAVRGFAAPPQPDATNLVLSAGDDPVADLLTGIERGLLVDDVIGGGQSNVLAGEFSVNVGLGYLVEGGQVHGRVKDCMVAGNVFELFSRIRGISNVQETHGAIVTPAVCFDAVSISAAE
ncbi:MAG: TldD/PmbA family protein [Candidatus Brocadiae bacterium]|nr:TldD/PmbA family protein [Candidatus Brocadiia bacterium]